MPSILHSYPSLLILTPFFFTDMVSNHDVVDCEGPTLKNHCYWPIVSDFINVLSHKTIAEMFMQNRDLIKQWLKFIGHLTGQVVSGEVTSTLLMFQCVQWYYYIVGAFLLDTLISQRLSPLQNLVFVNSHTNSIFCYLVPHNYKGFLNFVHLES